MREKALADHPEVDDRYGIATSNSRGAAPWAGASRAGRASRPKAHALRGPLPADHSRDGGRILVLRGEGEGDLRTAERRPRLLGAGRGPGARRDTRCTSVVSSGHPDRGSRVETRRAPGDRAGASPPARSRPRRRTPLPGGRRSDSSPCSSPESRERHRGDPGGVRARVPRTPCSSIPASGRPAEGSASRGSTPSPTTTRPIPMTARPRPQPHDVLSRARDSFQLRKPQVDDELVRTLVLRQPAPPG